jgi:hypothetical protein
VVWHLIGQSGGSQELPELADGEIQRLFDEEVIPDERVVGETEDGQPISVTFGKFGPYVRAGERTASIDAEDFNSITLDDALEQIDTKAAEKERRLINEFAEAGIQVLDGRYGPYVRRDGIKEKIPKSMDPTRLTVEDCENLLQKRLDKLARKSASKRRERLIGRVEDSARRSSKTEHVSESASEYALPLMDRDVTGAFEAPAESLRSFLVEDAVEFHASDELFDIRAQVRKIETRAQRSDEDKDRLSEYWARAPISEHIEIAVRGIDPEHSDLVESLAKKLGDLLGKA